MKGAKRAKAGRAETDMYPALRDWFLARGFTVRGEVRHADLVARRGELTVIVEMKTKLTMHLLAQGLRRRRLTSAVYVAVERPEKLGRGSPYADFKAVVKELGLGLFVVSFAEGLPQVQEVFAPKKWKVPPRQTKALKRSKARLENEFTGRSGDWNPGGSTGTPLVTAYREKTVRIAACFIVHGPLTPKALRELGLPQNVQAMVSRDYYKWFKKVSPGIYDLSESGLAEIRERHGALLDHYLGALRKAP
ncbi:MAG: hypothetical protein J0L75_20830 [Spirochaetes bacterium]|nr:hypothetical protein [Spirochaetota bacterium]